MEKKPIVYKEVMKYLSFILLFALLPLVGCQGSKEKDLSQMELTLYYRPGCPYCRKVIRFIDKNDISVTRKNIENPKYAKELLTIGGEPEVPALVIDGKVLYGSTAIIKWLQERLPEKAEKTQSSYK